jgi:hypothetical protein
MSQRDQDLDRPLEEAPEVAAAVDDETTVPQLRSEGAPDGDPPDFTTPGEVPPDRPATEDLLGDPYGAGSVGTRGRTGAEQPWDPADLAMAQGHDPSPHNVERAREQLAREGPAAVERTVP